MLTLQTPQFSSGGSGCTVSLQASFVFLTHDKPRSYLSDSYNFSQYAENAQVANATSKIRHLVSRVLLFSRAYTLCRKERDEFHEKSKIVAFIGRDTSSGRSGDSCDQGSAAAFSTCKGLSSPASRTGLRPTATSGLWHYGFVVGDRHAVQLRSECFAGQLYAEPGCDRALPP